MASGGDALAPPVADLTLEARDQPGAAQESPMPVGYFRSAFYLISSGRAAQVNFERFRHWACADPDKFVKEWADAFNHQFTDVMDRTYSEVRNRAGDHTNLAIFELAIATPDTPAEVATDRDVLNACVQSYAACFKDLSNVRRWSAKDNTVLRKWAWLREVADALPDTYKGVAIAEAWLARLFPISKEHTVHIENHDVHREVARRCLACAAVCSRVLPETIMRIVRFVRPERYYTTIQLEHTVPINTVGAMSVFLLMANAPTPKTAMEFVTAMAAGRRVACYKDHVLSVEDVRAAVATVLSQVPRTGLSDSKADQWALACAAVAIPSFCTRKAEDPTILRDSVRRLLLEVGLGWRQTVADAILVTFLHDEQCMYGHYDGKYGSFPGDIVQVHGALVDTNCTVPRWLEGVASHYNWHNVCLPELKTRSMFNAVACYMFKDAPADVVESFYMFCDRDVGMRVLAGMFCTIEVDECLNGNALDLFWKNGALDIERFERLTNVMETNLGRLLNSDGFGSFKPRPRPYWNGLAEKLAEGYPGNMDTLVRVSKMNGGMFLASMVTHRLFGVGWLDFAASTRAGQPSEMSVA